MVDFNSYQSAENQGCFSTLRAAIIVFLSSNSCNSESIFFSSFLTPLFWSGFELTLQHRGWVQKLTKNLQEDKRMRNYCLHIQRRGELSFCLLRILFPFCKEQKAHTENTHRKPTEKTKPAKKEEAAEAELQTNTTYLKYQRTKQATIQSLAKERCSLSPYRSGLQKPQLLQPHHYSVLDQVGCTKVH